MKKKIVYLSIISSLIGASTISLNLGLFQLSIFRLTIIFLAFVAIMEISLKDKNIRIKSSKNNSFSIKFMFIWIVYGIFSLGWVKDYSSWMKAIYFLSLGLLCILLMSRHLKNKFDVLFALRLISIMSIIHNLIGWYEVRTGNYLFLSTDAIEIYARNNFPVSIFNNTNGFATFMLFSIFISYICLVNANKFISKTVYISVIISSTSLLFMSSSRGNILGLIMASLVLVYFSMKNRKSRNIILGILISIFISILLYPHLLTNILLMISNSLSFRFSEQVGSDPVRMNLVKNGFKFLFETFGLGTGAGNIEYWMDNYAFYNTFGVLNIHNWWMEILVGYGFVVFILYIRFYINLYLTLLKKFKMARDKIDRSMSLGIMSCMAGYVVGSISNSSNIGIEWLWMFWAIAIAYQGVNNEDLLYETRQVKVNKEVKNG